MRSASKGGTFFCPAFSYFAVHIKNGMFLPITVVKKGQLPQGEMDYVDGISGGTITSKGVGAMLDECLQPYKAYLESLSKQ